MAKLIYSTIASLDGFVEDNQGAFEWAAPDDEVLAFVTELERPVGTYLYGRRMYDTMAVWQTWPDGAGQSGLDAEFAAIWRAADKIVYSRELQAASTPRTTIEHDFEPAVIRQLKDGAERDLTVGGASLAGQALAAGLVDECQLILSPVIIGGGKRALPADLRIPLDLIDERRFASGVVYLRYAVRG